MSVTILFVDNDATAMEALAVSFHHELECSLVTSYAEALALIKSRDDFPVLVSELDLNGEDGIEFLVKVREAAPQIVCLVHTHKTGFEDVVAAMNVAQASRFIPKPCPPEEMARYVARAVRRYAADRDACKVMTKSTLGWCKTLVDILTIIHPEAANRSKRIRSLALATGKALGIKCRADFEMAVTLSQLGCVALPAGVVRKMDTGKKFTPEEMSVFNSHPHIGAKLLARIEQMAPVAEIIGRQLERVGDDVPLESRILKAALDLDRIQQRGADTKSILKRMRDKEGVYDPQVVEAMQQITESVDSPPDSKPSKAEPQPVLKVEEPDTEEPDTDTGLEYAREVAVAELEQGMIMAADMVNNDGTALLLRGQGLTAVSLARIQEFHDVLGVVEPILVVRQDKSEHLA